MSGRVRPNLVPITIASKEPNNATQLATAKAGQAVFNACTVLFDSLNDFSFLVRSLSSELSGELVILCADQLDMVKQKSLARVIQQIHHQALKLQLVLDGESIPNIEKSLLRDKAPVGLFPNYKPVDGLAYTQVFSEPTYLCCARGMTVVQTKLKSSLAAIIHYFAGHDYSQLLFESPLGIGIAFVEGTEFRQHGCQNKKDSILTDPNFKISVLGISLNEPKQPGCSLCSSAC